MKKTITSKERKKDRKKRDRHVERERERERLHKIPNSYTDTRV